MLYFFYDHLLNATERSFAFGTPIVANHATVHWTGQRVNGAFRRAIARHTRLQFHEFDARYASVVADIAPEAGKFVSGAVTEISDRALSAIQHHYTQRAKRQLIRVSVHIPGETEFRLAYTHLSVETDWIGAAPSRQYVELLLNSAYELNASERWIAELRGHLIESTDKSNTFSSERWNQPTRNNAAYNIIRTAG